MFGLVVVREQCSLPHCAVIGFPERPSDPVVPHTSYDSRDDDEWLDGIRLFDDTFTKRDVAIVSINLTAARVMLGDEAVDMLRSLPRLQWLGWKVIGGSHVHRITDVLTEEQCAACGKHEAFDTCPRCTFVRTDAQKALDADRAATQARWEQAVQPGVTGVITPNTKPGGPLPYFTSEKTQATNNPMKQRRLEMFTGALDATSSETGTFRHKTETPARFKPEQNAMPVSFSGSSRVTAMGMDAATASRYVPSQLHQNIVPTQQVRVGRGVGVGTDVTATDGFHPMLRVMPKDFGWKKNNLPGGFVPGAAPICKRPSDVTVFSDNRPPRYWTQAQVALGPGRAVWTGPTTRSKDPGTGCGGSSKIVGSEYYGVMGGNDGSYTNSALPSRDRFDNNTGLPQANPTVARSGTGGYVNSAFDDSRGCKTGRPRTATASGC
ncbi:hypothetical protein D9Q98_004096 [Chlorella vulgaris]|uniref:DUF5899 domain-containing protein n=1 Tax=Chlorella vulgaris TaxID=3077 RepID=A0A9D4TRK7_CHLVU|nr:hypothetical protein D9Q98_004096 [Chlorella vulgaris]